MLNKRPFSKALTHFSLPLLMILPIASVNADDTGGSVTTMSNAPSSGYVINAAASSSVATISAQYTADYKSSQLTPIGQLKSTGYPFNTEKKLPVVKQVLAVHPLSPLPQLIVQAKNIDSLVKSSGMTIDTISAEAINTADNIEIDLVTLNQHRAVTHNYLTLKVSKLRTSSSFNEVVPNFTNATGATSFAGLTVSGSLVNATAAKPLSFSGTPKTNQVLYTSPEFSITLNTQITGVVNTCPGGAIVCPLSAGNQFFKTTNITTQAININFNGAMISGVPVNGSIIIGQTYAE